VQQALGGRSGVVHQRGVLLGDLIQPGNRLVDLVDALILLGAGHADLLHQLAHLTDLRHHLTNDLSGVVHQAAARIHLLDAAGDELLDLFGCLGTALCQRTHFAGHHGKATALLTRPRGLHGGVQGQDVGLEGNAIDHADDVGDLATGVLDARHGLDDTAHRIAPLSRHARGGAGQSIGLLRVGRTGADGGRDLLDRSRCFSDAGRGIGGAVVQLLVVLADGGTGLLDRLGRGAHILDGLLDALHRHRQTLARLAGDRDAGSRQIDDALLAGDGLTDVGQFFTDLELGARAGRQEEQDARFHHDVGGVLDHAAQAWLGEADGAPTPFLEVVEAQVVHGDGRSAHDDGQTAPVHHQHGQKGKDAEVGLGMPTAHVDHEPHQGHAQHRQSDLAEGARLGRRSARQAHRHEDAAQQQGQEQVVIQAAINHGTQVQRRHAGQHHAVVVIEQVRGGVGGCGHVHVFRHGRPDKGRFTSLFGRHAKN